jgi:hypothetical protein
MLSLMGLFALLAAAGSAQRGDEVEFWLPIATGAVAILAYAGLAEAVANVLSANS